jgi:hypothetical protein
MKNIIIFLILLILVSYTALAIGVAQEYLKDNMLTMKSGVSRIFTITLQNSDNFSLNVKVELQSTIAHIINYQEIYTIPPKYYDSYVRINITIPIGAKIGDRYPIDYYVQPLVLSDGAMIPVNLRINKHITVIVTDDTLDADISPTPEIQISDAPVSIATENEPIPSQQVIGKKPMGNDYFTGALILLILTIFIVYLWKKSSLLSKKLVKKPRRKRRPKRL